MVRILEAVSTEPLYQANEQHLCIEGLTEKLSVLHHLNRQVSAARVVWSNARIERNRVMYLLPQSLWQTIRAVRKYVRAISVMTANNTPRSRTSVSLNPENHEAGAAKMKTSVDGSAEVFF